MLRAVEKLLVLALFVSLAVPCSAEQVSGKALFRRCYSLLTQSFPDLGHPEIQKLLASGGDPITACLQVLDKAKLGANGLISVTNDQEARNILNTFQSLHYGWFRSKNFDTDLPDTTRDSTRDIYDVSSPAYYFTRALFNAGTKFSDIFTQNVTLGAVRTTMNPTLGLYLKLPLNQWWYTGGNFQYVPSGDLLGIRQIASTVVTQGSRNAPLYGPLTLFGHYGGGVLGSSPYLTFNVKQNAGYRTNASGSMPRKWSQAVLSDFLCRELPVVRTADVASYVVPDSSIAFRKANTCVRCHASIDQMAGTVRQLTLTTYENNYTGTAAEIRPSASVITPHLNLGLAAAPEWPAAVDNNYYRKPTTGRFVFRTFDGMKFDEPLAGVNDLGLKISQLDDPYVCVAKRYYRYFTGIDIRMTDFTDPDPGTGYKMTETELKHWNQIVKLGKNLKNHQQLRLLIEEILRSDSFMKSNFNAQGDGL